MKTSVSSYSFGAYGHEDRLGLFGMIDKAAELGFDGIEFLDSNIPDEATAKRVAAQAKDAGIAVVAFCVGADFLSGSQGDLSAEVKRVCRLCDIAAALGAPAMRHDISSGRPGMSYDAALPRLAEAAYDVTEYAAKLGLRTMTENHGCFSQDATRVEKLLNTVAHPNFGALVDVGNFMCADEDPWKSVSVMAPYAFHVHVKDFHHKPGNGTDPGAGWFRTRGGDYLRGAIIGHGDARVAQSLQTLKKSGYDGYCTVEFEGMEDNLKGITLGRENLLRFWG